MFKVITRFMLTKVLKFKIHCRKHCLPPLKAKCFLIEIKISIFLDISFLVDNNLFKLNKFSFCKWTLLFYQKTSISL